MSTVEPDAIAHRAGRLAYREGQTLSANPYLPGTSQRQAWHDGWRWASYQAERGGFFANSLHQ